MPEEVFGKPWRGTDSRPKPADPGMMEASSRHGEGTAMVDIEIRDLGRGRRREAAAVLGRGMRDNPINVAAFEADPARRERVLTRFFRAAVYGLSGRGTVGGALREGRVVGVCGMAPPGRCHPTPEEKTLILPTVLLGTPFGTTGRVVRWSNEWAQRDPGEPHWHLGPVAVDPALQGLGIGTLMLTDFCARVDDRREVAYLETDKPENVRFYRRFGFEVVEEADVLAVPNWFMRRPRAV
ncbi:GNAT family N-acetyltransferase [Nocardia sp. ET3-3]|uniref:GNAT family N-acetyltransferase n=1 Tax=Nocardia terrae TaxID=2675851 RepID=A0A7K1V7Y4_9NOCA|nr:GNAT family N-acetyltransferase [Nocardia terrae]MVU82647.1 GNAT family N-acetyltransferase [Nocardia terrae]